MPDPRETFILEQDIAAGQISDVHLKAGTRIWKLVEKKVIDTLYLSNIPVIVGATSKRLDGNLIDILRAVGPNDIGLLTDRKHQLLRSGTDEAFLDTAGREVTVDLVFTASLNFQVNLVTGSNQGTTVGDPGDVQIGDIIRVVGQGLVAPYITTIINKVAAGPNFVLTFQNNFVQGPSQVYTAERINRWEALFKDSEDNPYQMPVGQFDIGLFQRVYLADIAESFGLNPLKHPELAPEAGLANPPPPGAPFSSAVVEVVLDAGEAFLWFHGLNTDIPLLTWWVEWPGYPLVRFYYGLQAINMDPVNSNIEGVPSLRTTTPVDFKHVDENYIEIKNRNTVTHRVKAIVLKTSI